MPRDDKILLHHAVLRSNRKVMLVIHVFLPNVRNCLFQTDVYILSRGLIQFPTVLGNIHLPRNYPRTIFFKGNVGDIELRRLSISAVHPRDSPVQQ